MPTTPRIAESSMDGSRRWLPEAVLAILACLVFFGFLGSVELWGKREQRASAEAIDTIDHNHWLVAQIQGRPRLEKPPLPRWTIAVLMTLTGRRDEWMVRFPSALSAIGMVALVYALGKRLGGRSVGLAAGLALTSMGFFISELRQAGNDGPLAFFTTLALYAAWRRLYAEPESDPKQQGEAITGSRMWNLLFYGAMGCGFLCKGPIVLMVVAIALVPYFLCTKTFKRGVGLLFDGRGVVLFILVALSWPVPVLLNDPNAGRVWLLEMGQKAGTAGISHHRFRAPLAADWPWMTLPWAILATLAVLLPFLKRVKPVGSALWFPWWWAVGNLVMFCFWSVAKPNYFLPCLPGAAILAGIEWVRLTRTARLVNDREGNRARRILQIHWVAIFVGAAVLPIVIHSRMPEFLGWSVAFSIGSIAAVIASSMAWRRGADAGALAPLTATVALGVLIGYGALGPVENAKRSHRELAETLDRVLPRDEHTVMFFHEIDEGLWFYLHDREIIPVPGSQPEYNDAFKLIEDLRNNRYQADWRDRMKEQEKKFVNWLNTPGRPSRYVLIRDKEFNLFEASLKGLVVPVFKEEGLKRNPLVLLEVISPDPIATKAEDSARR